LGRLFNREIMSGLMREELLEMLPAYALGALDADERAAVDAGLARFPELRAELARYQAVTTGLNASVPQRTPPPALKAGLLAKIAPKPAAQPSWWQRAIDALSQSSLTPRLALAALVLVAGLVLAQAASSHLAYTAEQQKIQSIVAGSTEQIVLNGTANAPEAVAVVHYVDDQLQAAMEVRNLPALDRNQAYQLWLTNSKGERWSGAVFTVPQSGGATVLVNCPEPMHEIVRLGVSIEPAGGSPGPTGPAVLRTTRS
jgi:anti-sigma-K factor RskA